MNADQHTRTTTNGGGRPVTVMIVDDHPVVRAGLSQAIQDAPDCVVCAECATVTAALEQVRTNPPDVAVIDLSLDGENGLDLVKTLIREAHRTRALVLSMHDELLYASRALRAGARGYIMKDQAMDHVVTAIQRVAQGKTYVSDAVAEQLFATASGQAAGRPSGSPVDGLTDRERQVFELIGTGCRTRDIARRLHLSVKTIDTHRARIKEKLGLRHGGELVRAAVSWVERLSP